MTDGRQFELRFGVLSPPLKEQMEEQGIEVNDTFVNFFQPMLEAVTKLHIHNVLTDKEVGKARTRIIKKMTNTLNAIKERME